MATIMRYGDDLYTSREVAGLFGISIQTLRRWTLEGLIECSRLPGGQRRYPARAVNELLRTRKAARS